MEARKVNRSLVATLLTLPLLAAIPLTISAQQPTKQPAAQPLAKQAAPEPDSRPPRAARPAPQMIPLATGSISIHELPSNQESHVDTDRFIGYPSNAFPLVWNGLALRSMLRHGDPYEPGPAGAVLEYRDDLSVATLQPSSESGTKSTNQVSFYYVQGGSGRIDTGPKTTSYGLRPGVGILIAPGISQHFVANDAAPLSMIRMVWSDNEGLKVKQPIKLQDTATEEAGDSGVHWVMSGKHLFDVEDGINLTAGAVSIPANTYSGPHGHAKGVEEIWVKTGTDLGYAMLGSEIRKIDGSGAFLAPPNGLTTHSSMNTNDDHPAVWLYLSRRTPTHTGP
jgi:hypothetical protein